MNLKEKIEKAGIDNCIFLVPMKPLSNILGIKFTSSNSKEVIVPAQIIEDHYKIKDNHKITLECIYKGFGKEHFYISDLKSLIKQNSISFYIKQNA